MDEAALTAEIEAWWQPLPMEEKMPWIDAYLHGLGEALAHTLPKEHREISDQTWVWKHSGGWIMTQPMRDVINAEGAALADRQDYWSAQLAELLAR